MNKIKLKVGNLFDDIEFNSDIITIIPHIVNDIGAWGSGFVIPLGKKYPMAKDAYLKWYNNHYDIERKISFTLGSTQFVECNHNIYVANMLAQHKIISKDNPQPINYICLKTCLETIYERCINLDLFGYKLKILAPAFGTERAGGDPKIIWDLINKEWYLGIPIDITIYSLSKPHIFEGFYNSDSL